MRIDEVHRLILLGVNKTQTGYLSPPEIDDFFNRAQRAEFADLLGIPGTQDQKGYARVRKIHRDLAPFRVSAISDSDTGGLVSTPTELEYLIAVMAKDNTPIDICTESQLAYRLTSNLIPINASFPAAEETDTGFQIYPKEQYTDVKYWYLATPTNVEYVHTVAGRTIIYDDAASTHPQWKGAALERVINRAIELAGEYLQSQYTAEKSAAKTQRGL